MTNTALFFEKMSACFWTVKTLAKEMGMSRGGLYKKINNTNEFKASEIKTISKLFDLTAEEREKIFLAS